MQIGLRLLFSGLAALFPILNVHSEVNPAKNAEPGDIWKIYLSPSEQKTLGDMMSFLKENSSSEGQDGGSGVDLESMLKTARLGFEQFMAQWAPPFENLQGTPMEEQEIKGMWFKTTDSDPERILLYFHGGGFMVGNPSTSASITGFLAKEAGITCLSLDYPLAPEFPYPAALDNAVAAYKYLLEKGYKSANIVLAGDSAGGGLALSALLKIRELKLPVPAGAYLVSPWTDLTLSFPTHESKKKQDAVLSRDFLQMMVAPYAGEHDPANPFISPALADLRGLPPILIQVGSYETLLDDSLMIARNGAVADVPVTLSVWPGYYHIFPAYHSKLEGSRKALKEAAVFIDKAMGKKLLTDNVQEQK